VVSLAQSLAEPRPVHLALRARIRKRW
jgi:hypothetical protein